MIPMPKHPPDIYMQIRETARQWYWPAIRHPDVSTAVALTFVNYEVMSSPLLSTIICW